MRALICVVIGVMSMMMAGNGALGAEYFVSVEGSDQAPGTRADPWASIAKANESVGPGDTVTFMEGEYEGTIQPATSGEEGAPIVYRAANSLGAVLRGGEVADLGRLCVYLRDRSHIVIEGFHLLPISGVWMR